MAAVNLSIWVAARCHPGLNQCQIAAIAIDRGDYLWRRNDYLLHRLRRACGASRRGSLFLLCAMGLLGKKCPVPYNRGISDRRQARA